MKIASRIFILLEAICNIFIAAIVALIGSIIFAKLDPTQLSWIKIFALLVVIVAIITIIIEFVVLFVALNKIKNAKSKKQLIAIGIITILTCSVLGGIFTLCIPEKSLQQ